MQYWLASLVKDSQTDAAVIPTSHLLAHAAHSTLPGECTHIKDFPRSPAAAHLPAAEAGTWVKIQWWDCPVLRHLLTPSFHSQNSAFSCTEQFDRIRGGLSHLPDKHKQICNFPLLNVCFYNVILPAWAYSVLRGKNTYLVHLQTDVFFQRNLRQHVLLSFWSCPHCFPPKNRALDDFWHWVRNN